MVQLEKAAQKELHGGYFRKEFRHDSACRKDIEYVYQILYGDVS